MNKTLSAPGVLLFCSIPLRFIIEWMPLVGFPIISTAMVGVQYIAMLFCVIALLSSRNARNLPKLSKCLLIIYTIYTLYLFYDLMINPKLPRQDILRAPATDFELFQNSISLGLTMFFCWYCNIKVDFIKWAKASCIFLTVMLLIYGAKVDLRLYAIERFVVEANNAGETNMSDYGAFDALRLGWFCGINYVCNLFLKTKWTKSKFVNNIIFWTISIFTFSIIIVTLQRGPIVFLITTTLFYLFAKGYLSPKHAKIVIPILLIFAVFSSYIFNNILNVLAPELMERFANTLEEGASGRFGSDDSAYSLAFDEILKNPLFGHYFRYTETGGYFYGLYPHNILLEALMTMGIVFSIPFFVILWCCVKKSYYAIQNDAPVAVFGLIFIYILSTLMTSASMVLMSTFWVPFAVISAYLPKSKVKI